jgi:AraC-like DNA-binding protein
MLSRPTTLRRRPASGEPAWLARINPQLHTAWSGSWRPGTDEPARILIDHELVLVASGRCSVALGPNTRRLGAGEWIIIPPGLQHASRTGPDTGCLRHCVHFDWEWCGPAPEAPPWTWLPDEPPRQALRRTPDFVPPGILQGSTGPESIHLAERLHLAWASGSPRSARLHALELLLRLLAPHEVVISPDPRRELARQVKEVLDQRTDARFRLRDELAPLGVSYEHLCRCFSRTYGVAPLHYLQIARIERAKRLLIETRDPLPQIAAATGFGDDGALASCFKRITGVSPGTWRRRESSPNVD